VLLKDETRRDGDATRTVLVVTVTWSVGDWSARWPAADTDNESASSFRRRYLPHHRARAGSAAVMSLGPDRSSCQSHAPQPLIGLS